MVLRYTIYQVESIKERHTTIVHWLSRDVCHGTFHGLLDNVNKYILQKL